MRRQDHIPSSEPSAIGDPFAAGSQQLEREEDMQNYLWNEMVEEQRERRRREIEHHNHRLQRLSSTYHRQPY